MAGANIGTHSRLPTKARCYFVVFNPDRGKYCELKVMPLRPDLDAKVVPSYLCRDFKQFEEEMERLGSLEEIDRQNAGKFPSRISTTSATVPLLFADFKTRLMQAPPGTEAEFVSEREIGLEDFVHFGWQREVIEELLEPGS